MLDFDRCMIKMRREYDYSALRAAQAKSPEAVIWWVERAEKLIRLIQLFASIRDEK